MRRQWGRIGGALAFVVLAQGLAWGQQAAPKAGTVDERLKAVEEAVQSPVLSLLREVTLTGYVQTTYNFNFEDPPTKTNNLRVFDDEANQFTINNIELAFSRQPTEKVPVGFGVVMNAGRDTRKTKALGLGGGATGDDNPFDLQQAYVTYVAPVGKGVTFKAGKFATLLGAEVIEAPANFNVSRSFLFGFAIPFTHVGALATYPFTDQVSATVGVVNGWDNVRDDNRGKSAIGQISLAPLEGFTLLVNGIWGAEQAERDSPKRWVVDVVATYNPPSLKALTLQANYDYGREDEAAEDGASILRDATWQGISLIANYDLTEKLSFAVRGEYFIDQDGARTAFAGPGPSGLLPRQSRLNVYEITATAKYKLWGGLFTRLEYRHDQSITDGGGQRVFDGETGVSTRKRQDTITVELAYVF
ncbi:MAG: porin [candidate division NC10 bacterium]|nr:porin [candidate division NC10 bacterium]